MMPDLFRLPRANPPLLIPHPPNPPNVQFLSVPVTVLTATWMSHRASPIQAMHHAVRCRRHSRHLPALVQFQMRSKVSSKRPHGQTIYQIYRPLLPIHPSLPLSYENRAQRRDKAALDRSTRVGSSRTLHLLTGLRPGTAMNTNACTTRTKATSSLGAVRTRLSTQNGSAASLILKRRNLRVRGILHQRPRACLIHRHLWGRSSVTRPTVVVSMMAIVRCPMRRLRMFERRRHLVRGLLAPGSLQRP